MTYYFIYERICVRGISFTKDVLIKKLLKKIELTNYFRKNKT